MGKKDGDLWDDSALVDALNQAMTNYKAMHSAIYNAQTSKEEDSSDKIEDESGLSKETDRHTEPYSTGSETPNNARETFIPCDNAGKQGMDSQIQENQPSNASHPSENLPEASSSHKIPEGYSDYQGVEYRQLLSQYYELEGQRQKLLGQLHQASYFNHESSAQYSTTEAHQGADYYGCYSGPFAPSCLSGCYPLCCQGPSHAVCCNSAGSNTPYAQEKRKGRVENAGGHGSPEMQNSSAETDLQTLLYSWYSAGYHTGRFLSQQSLEKGHH